MRNNLSIDTIWVLVSKIKLDDFSNLDLKIEFQRTIEVNYCLKNSIISPCSEALILEKIGKRVNNSIFNEKQYSIIPYYLECNVPWLEG